MTRHLAALALWLPAAVANAAGQVAEVRLWPEESRLEGRARLELAAPRPVRFRLAQGLAVEAASLDGRPVTVRRAGDGWVVDAPATGRVVELRYAGSVAAEGAPPFLAPAGGFLPGGTGWLPETDQVPAGFDLTLEVPQPYAAVATGRLAEEATAGGTYRARFMGGLTDEPPSAFVGSYRIAERRQGDVRVRAYLDPADMALADLYLGRTIEQLDRYGQEIGPYPYAGFSVVSAPIPVGLGFPGIAYVARQILPLPFMQTTSLAHEILHSWWGNAVEVAYDGGNWAEGLTTYMADYALAERQGPEQAQAMRLAWLRDFSALPPERDAPLTAFVARGHDASQVVGYNKAAFVFHMLRRRVGDAAFAEAIRRFYADHRFRSTSWADLRQSFEAVTGEKLDGFFAQWLKRPGAPRLRLDEVGTREVPGGQEVSVVVRQDEPTYALDLPVVLDTDRGRTLQVVPFTTGEVTIVLPAQGRPLRLAIDPEHDLFRYLAPGEAPPILRDVTLGAAATLIAARDEATEALARQLAGRLLDAGSSDATRIASAPVLAIGLVPDLAAALREAGLPATPPELKGRGTARVWTVRRADAPPVLVVEADDTDALAALLRPLPHYRRESWLVFEGAKAIDRGVWPAGDGALAHRFE
jgi:aminopeptidase N